MKLIKSVLFQAYYKKKSKNYEKSEKLVDKERVLWYNTLVMPHEEVLKMSYHTIFGEFCLRRCTRNVRNY